MTGTDQVSNVGVDRESIVGSVDKEVEPLTNVFLNTNLSIYDILRAVFQFSRRKQNVQEIQFYLLGMNFGY